jgi:nucleotide-binding universal stress UspA family protein
MWCKHIMVAYDGSEQSKAALKLATEIALDDPSIEVSFVHALVEVGVLSAGIGGFVALEGELADEAHEIAKYLEKVAATLPNATQVKVLRGFSPADLMINYARKHNVDTIVMGSRGKGGFIGYLGSASLTIAQKFEGQLLIAK